MKVDFDDVFLGFGFVLVIVGIIIIPNDYGLVYVILGSLAGLGYAIKRSRDKILKALEEKSQVVTKE